MARPALNVMTLPPNQAARREFLEERAKPNLSRPRLKPDVEARLAAIEEQHAQCYVHAEETVYRLFRAAERINSYIPRSVEPDSPSRARTVTMTGARADTERDV